MLSQKVDTNTWLNKAVQEAQAEAERRLKAQVQTSRLAKYEHEPVLFGTEVLSEYYTDDCKELMLSVRDNPVTIAKSGNSVGKTHSAARLAAWFFLVYDDAKVYITAAPPLDNLKRLLWGEIMAIAQKRPELFSNFKVRSLSITRSPKSFITGVAIPQSGTTEERIAKFSGKHAPHLLFIVDEGDAVPDEIYTGIDSCMSGGLARLLIMFNPKASLGPIYNMEYTGRAKVVHLSALRHPNVVTGTDIIPGAVDRQTVIRRINEWTRPALSDELDTPGTFALPSYLEGASAQSPSGEIYPPLSPGARKITEPAFSFMVLGEYPPQSELQLISQDWIEAARTRWDNYVALYGERPPDGVQPIMGLDVAELGPDNNVAALRYGGFVPRFMIWNGLDADLSAQKAYDIYNQYNCQICYVDSAGIGSAVAPSMYRRGTAERRDVRAVSVKTSSKPTPGSKTEMGEFYSLRDQLYWTIREWLRSDPTAMLPPDPFLTAELTAPRYDTFHGGRIKITDKPKLRDKLKRSTDRADALALTFMPLMRATILRAMD